MLKHFFFLNFIDYQCQVYQWIISDYSLIQIYRARILFLHGYYWSLISESTLQ